MFKWDGTDVTDIISHSNIYEAEYNKNKYWVITLDKYSEICLVKNAKSSLPCLIDELKPIFGLQKLGTHYFRYKNKTKLIVKTLKTPEGYIKEELTLDKIETINPLLKLQVQEIFAFRELLGITCSYVSSIIVRENGNNIYPVSYYEPNMLTTDGKIVPFGVLDKWFGDVSIDSVVQKLCRIHDINKLGEVIFKLRIEIETVIERTDRKNISYKDCIINRITERLQTSLSGSESP